MDEILHIKNLSKRYGDTKVLKNINISVKKGEVVVLSVLLDVEKVRCFAA